MNDKQRNATIQWVTYILSWCCLALSAIASIKGKDALAATSVVFAVYFIAAKISYFQDVERTDRPFRDR